MAEAPSSSAWPALTSLVIDASLLKGADAVIAAVTTSVRPLSVLKLVCMGSVSAAAVAKLLQTHKHLRECFLHNRNHPLELGNHYSDSSSVALEKITCACLEELCLSHGGPAILTAFAFARLHTLRVGWPVRITDLDALASACPHLICLRMDQPYFGDLQPTKTQLRLVNKLVIPADALSEQDPLLRLLAAFPAVRSLAFSSVSTYGPDELRTDALILLVNQLQERNMPILKALRSLWLQRCKQPRLAQFKKLFIACTNLEKLQLFNSVLRPSLLRDIRKWLQTDKSAAGRRDFVFTDARYGLHDEIDDRANSAPLSQIATWSL